METVSAVQAGDIALLRSQWRLTGTASDGTPIEMSHHGTEVLQRHPDFCQIIGRGDVFQQAIVLLVSFIRVAASLAAHPVEEAGFKFWVDNAVLVGVDNDMTFKPRHQRCQLCGTAKALNK